MDTSLPGADRQRQQQVARVLLGVALAALGLWTLQGFLRALVWAGILAIAVWPLYARTQRRFGVGRHNVLLPLLFTVGATALVVVPLGLLATQVGHEARIVLRWVSEARTNGIAAPDWLQQLPFGAAQAAAWWDENLAQAEDAAALLGRIDRTQLIDVSRAVGGKLAHQIVILGFTLLTLFFLFRDGPGLAERALAISHRVFGPHGERVTRQIVASVHGTVDGMVLVGVGVGAVLGVGYALAGVPHPALLGALTAVAAIIPLGAPLVLGAAALVAVAQGHTVAGAVLFGAGMVVIFVADHAIRPALIGGATKLPFLWVLLGLLGGIETFGLVGLFLGPAIMAVLILLWREWTTGATTDTSA